MRAVLDAADARGLPKLADKAANGASLTPEEREQVHSYEETVQAYVASGCHTVGKG